VTKAAKDEGATVKIIAPKVSGVKLADGSLQAADGQLAGSPSVLFDAVVLILSGAGAAQLSREAAAIDFVRDAYGHLKAIGVGAGGRTLLRGAQLGMDPGIIDLINVSAFIEAAKGRNWAREVGVRTLA